MLSSVLSGIALHDHASSASMGLLVSVLMAVFDSGAIDAGAAGGSTIEVIPRCRFWSAESSFGAVEICFANATASIGAAKADATETVDKALKYPKETLVAM